MSLNPISSRSRRGFLAGGATFTIVKPELVRGFAPPMLKAGLVGCGGRGSQAAVDLLTGAPNVELVSMGDLFEDKLESSFSRMRRDRRFEAIKDRIKVTPERKHMGFNAYKRVVESDVDIVMLCTPPGWRPIHFEAAVDARKHVFAEKPIATDPTGVRRFIAAARKAEQMKLTVMSGAQNHHSVYRKEQVKQIQDGAIGDIVATYAFYLVPSPVFHVDKRDAKWGDMEWEHRNWYSFLWLCGDQIVEQHFHNIDFVNWVMGTHPVSAVASGGAVWRPREELYGNIYDHMATDFVYPNGVRLTSHCRQYPPKTGFRRVGEVIAGSKGTREFMNRGRETQNPQETEHTVMVQSITGQGPYVNQGLAIAESTLTCIMGRESAYSGLEITWDQIMNSKQDLMPKVFDYKEKMTAPELPVPGRYQFS
ncbi:MAG: Gfo/Idh/MocA family oxidoreductase [Bryobacterales bacterium]|nr:Gfo/Idh/MocA family oxidoreductase [Bryobacterales bacterium]